MASDFHIVLVDDSVPDALMIERAFREGSIDLRLTPFQDGRLALDYLLATRPGEPEQVAVDRPDLVLLDLNLPGLDGLQVLAAIKSDPELKSLPVVILSTSGLDEDIARAYLAGANTYIRKPDEYPRYGELVATLRQYWHLTASRFPQSTRRPSPPPADPIGPDGD